MNAYERWSYIENPLLPRDNFRPCIEWISSGMRVRVINRGYAHDYLGTIYYDLFRGNIYHVTVYTQYGIVFDAGFPDLNDAISAAIREASYIEASREIENYGKNDWRVEQ